MYKKSVMQSGCFAHKTYCVLDVPIASAVAVVIYRIIPKLP